MNWSKAKLQVFVSLIILNVLLLVLNYTFSPNYRMSTEQNDAIIKVMEKQNVIMKTEIPTTYKPMSSIKLGVNSGIDIDVLERVFFDSSVNITRTADTDKVTLSNGLNSLTIFPTKFLYTSNVVLEGDMTKEELEILCREFMEQLPFDTKNYFMNVSRELSNRYLIEFREVYNNIVVQGNCISFLVNSGGIISVEYNASEILEQTKSERIICSPDEALLTAIFYINNTYGNEETTINDVEIVYHTGSMDTYSDDMEILTASPYYCVYIDLQVEPILINAHTNTII